MAKRSLIRSGFTGAFIALGASIFAPQASAHTNPTAPQQETPDVPAGVKTVADELNTFPFLKMTVLDLTCTRNPPIINIWLNDNQQLIISGPNKERGLLRGVGIFDRSHFPDLKPISVQTQGSDGRWGLDVGKFDGRTLAYQIIAQDLLKSFGYDQKPALPANKGSAPCVPVRAP